MATPCPLRSRAVALVAWVIASTGWWAVPAGAANLRPGDIVVADAATDQIVSVDPATGARTVITSGGFFTDPAFLVVAGLDHIYVADYLRGALIKVDAASGAQTALAFVENPTGVAWDRAGQLLVTSDRAQGALLRIDPATGETAMLASGIGRPRGLAVATDGTVYIANFDSIVRIDSQTRAVTTLSSSGHLDYAFDVAIDAGGDLLIANEHGPGVVRVDAMTGVQTLVARGRPFINPMGIVIDADGSVLVANQGTFAQNGGVVRLDPVTGATTVLSPIGWLAGIEIVVPEPGGAALAFIALSCGLRRKSRPPRATGPA
jgi:DNA-binding beta-propeller fold protein YncE